MKKAFLYLVFVVISVQLLFSYKAFSRPTSSGFSGIEVLEDVPGPFRERFKKVLSYLRKIRLEKSTDLHKKFFGESLSGEVYVDLLKNSISKVAIDGFMNGTTIAYISPFRLRTMFITRQFNDLDISLPLAKMLFVSGLVHESWHSYGGQFLGSSFGHTKCPHEDLNGEPLLGIGGEQSLDQLSACDESYFGAYGVQAVMLFNVSKYCLNCTEEEKLAALYLFEEMSRRIVDPSSYSRIVDDTKN